MCYIGDGEPFEIFDERPVKARKNHKCDCCNGAIVRGEKYTRHFSKFEGEIASEKICAACDADREEFADHHEGVYFAPSKMREQIRECLYERSSLKNMLLWRRMLWRMDKRKSLRRQF